jgi:hypothetical protein
VPEFWSWLAHQAEQGAIKMPLEIFEEVKDGSTDEEKDLLTTQVVEATLQNALRP